MFPAYHGVAWYWHTFRLDGSGAAGDRVLIHFGAVDYLAEVWLNGKWAGAYEGGETPFDPDVTELINGGGDRTNLLAVGGSYPTRVESDQRSN